MVRGAIAHFCLHLAPPLLVLAAAFSFLALLFLGVLVLAAAFSFLVLLFLGVLVLAGTFSFLVLLFFGFGCAGGGSSESYTVSLQVFCICPN